MNFRQLPTQSRNLPTNFRDAGRHSVNFRQHFVRLETSSTSVIFLCRRETFNQLLSTIRAFRIPSINIHGTSERPGDLTSTSVHFQCGQETFLQLPSTFHAPWRPSVNFRQHSVHPVDLPSTSVVFPCGRMTFHQLPSTFRTAGRLSVKFCQLSVWPRDLPSNLRMAGGLPSTFVSFQCCWQTFVKFREFL